MKCFAVNQRVDAVRAVGELDEFVAGGHLIQRSAFPRGDQFDFAQRTNRNHATADESKTTLSDAEAGGEIGGEAVVAVSPRGDGFDFESQHACQIAKTLSVPAVE